MWGGEGNVEQVRCVGILLLDEVDGGVSEMSTGEASADFFLG